jgi:catechol 2,3-dioxygenase-like lactoylglutathione lyase family enzyme
VASEIPNACLHHVAFGACDVELIAGFYRELFGLSEVARHTDPSGALRSIWLTLGGAILMIERVTTTAPQARRDALGPFLLAIAVTPADRLRLEGVLTERGHGVESRTAFTSYARDPEGNRFAFSTWPEPSEG